MKRHKTGRRILKERPMINQHTLPIERMAQLPDGTFGREYARFMDTWSITSETRAPVSIHLNVSEFFLTLKFEVKYISDPELAYVMQRYRQVHDFMHTLTGIPITVEGEIGLKLFEFGQTGLPMAALSGISGMVLLRGQERTRLYEQYLPWALRNVSSCKEFLLNVYYEKELETPLFELQNRLGIRPFKLDEE
jgi:ubiquinone biosynthesis protein COQ4